MSYISAIQKGDDVIVWERNELGERIEQIYRAPFYFYVDDEDGKYETIYGTRVDKYEAANWFDYRKTKKQCDEKGIRMWESDIPPEMRILSNHYYNIPAPKLHITFFDIEVNATKELGWSSVKNPYAEINSVAILHHWKNELFIICVPPEEGWDAERLEKECNEREPIPSKFTTRFIVCDGEKELLLNFLAEIDDSDVIAGWNSDMFDTPYVGRRLAVNFGEKAVAKLDFDGAQPRWRDVKARKTQKIIGTTLDLQGRASLDYMNLVKKYEPGERPSYKLAAVSDDVLVDDDDQPILPKMEYEGTLRDLYYKDFAFFVRYNIRDTEILGGFEDKLVYVELANQMVHISTAQFNHVLGTLKLAEYATINYCHYEMKQVVPNFYPTPPEEDRQIEGALVLEPKVGEHYYTGSIDIKSLYPSVIIAINISPETIRGQFVEKFEAAEAIAKSTSMPLTLELETGKTVEMTALEFREWLKERKWAISGYGTVYDQTVRGIIPMVLSGWFDKRIEYQKLMKQMDAAGEKEKAAYYDRLQYVYKIKLNSFYGALTNLYFRFYDIRMGESVTGTGRPVVRHQGSTVNLILCDEYDINGDAVVAGDTDSTYFHTYADSVDEAVMIADAVAKKVNATFPEFMINTFLVSPGYENSIRTSRELVSDRGIFVEKKHYILHVADQEGKRVDKMKIMGLATKKTTLPREIAKTINKFIERYLKGEEWSSVAESVVAYKEQLINAPDITTLGLPKTVQEIDYFYDKDDFRRFAKQDQRTGRTRVSGHVRAALHYNRCLKEYKDTFAYPITDGTKSKVFYLIGTFEPLQLINGEMVHLETIALPTDMEFIPEWFPRNFRVDIDAQIHRLVDKPLESILKAIGKKAPSKQSLLVESLLSF
ncbi:MAG: hypothetical protein E4H14_06830 [Candidatus Thorarchaeota archaeon]|nr:MAG: hypothetical protein E4H14_06830 [Candidatus Thorarchaeota archaeon]